MTEIIGVRFKSVGKMYYFSPDGRELKIGDKVIVETARGVECGEVVLGNKVVEDDQIVAPLKPVIRTATEEDLCQIEKNRLKEKEAFGICEKKIAQYKLNMSLVDVECTFDNSKLLFYFTSENRVDFRELVKDLASTFKTRIELRQIGVRDETSLLCGNGLCGRPFCCCTFLRKFDSINIKLAKDQGMPITPGKISGTCGRLLCCLNYEYKNYIDAAKDMPPIGSGVMTPDGLGRVCSLHFLSNEIAVKTEDGKIKNYKKDEIEMVDSDVNIEIDIQDTASIYQEQSDYNVDIKQLEDDRNSSTGNV